MLRPVDGLYRLTHERIAINAGTEIRSANYYHPGDSLPTGDALITPFFSVPCPVCGETRWLMGRAEALPDTFEVYRSRGSGRDKVTLTPAQAQAAFFDVFRQSPGVYFEDKGVRPVTEVVGDVVSLRLKQARHYVRNNYQSQSTPIWGHQCDPTKTQWWHCFSTVETLAADLFALFKQCDALPGEYTSGYQSAGQRLTGGEPAPEDCARLAARLLAGDDVHPGLRLARERSGAWPHLAWSLASTLFEPDKSVVVPEQLGYFEQKAYRQRAGNWDRLFG